LATWDLTRRQLCDLELLATGACAPLDRFMTRRDYDAVCARMRLADGALWPVPDHRGRVR
jgi:sulfate adenylyltransferase